MKYLSQLQQDGSYVTAAIPSDATVTVAGVGATNEGWTEITQEEHQQIIDSQQIQS